MWGFLTCTKDIRVPHLKSIFDLSYAQVMLIQFAFFSAYFWFSIPWAKVCERRLPENHGNRIGLYGRGLILIFALASLTSFPVFLGALIVLAAGTAGLQLGANAYVVVFGKPETSANQKPHPAAGPHTGVQLSCTKIAPKLGGLLILGAGPLAVEEMKSLSPAALHHYKVQEAASVNLPQTVIAVAVLLLAVLIATSKSSSLCRASPEKAASRT